MKNKKKSPVKKRIKKRNRSATEKELLKAATQLFASKGYFATRTLEIAQKADVNEALIARYFGGKEGLLVAVLKDNDASQQIINSKEQQCSASEWIPTFKGKGDLKKALRAFFVSGLRHVEEKQSFVRIALSQSLIDPKMAELLRSRIFDQNFKLMTDNLKGYFGRKISRTELESVVMLLMAANFSLNFMMRTVHEIDSERVDRVIALLIDALAAHLDS